MIYFLSLWGATWSPPLHKGPAPTTAPSLGTARALALLSYRGECRDAAGNSAPASALPSRGSPSLCVQHGEPGDGENAVARDTFGRFLLIEMAN